MNVCCCDVLSVPVPVTVIVALPVKFAAGVTSRTAFWVSVITLAEVIVTGVLA